MNFATPPAELFGFGGILHRERERARAAMLAEGMAPALVEELLKTATEMHEGQIALVEREVALALGTASIH